MLRQHRQGRRQRQLTRILAGMGFLLKRLIRIIKQRRR
jgi:hypothetical protein